MTTEERDKAIRILQWLHDNNFLFRSTEEDVKYATKIAIEALEQKPRKGYWLRMSDLSEQEDDRYKCSYCGNVIHHKNRMNLYTFNSWCGRCGSDNESKIEVEL